MKDFLNGFLLKVSGNEVCQDGFLIEQVVNEKEFICHPRK